MRYHLKERALNLTDDFIIRDETGTVVYDVKGDFLKVGDTFAIYDHATGDEVLYLKKKILSDTTHYDIIQKGVEVASLRRRAQTLQAGITFEVSSKDGMVFYIQGNFNEWDFNIVDHYDRLLGHITREFAMFGDSYTVDVVPNVDGPFILAIAIILDEIREDGGKDYSDQ
ncbi:hypothetical protein KDW_27730 [Dictyobacter vulcani]|uniref:LURP-one-related family protein n=1 Tax=Dictyobacter vulcani TaxID=2607529 RepID=A0A5J4KQE8_9CHLR|nr:LURP-one-related family protein [Dictyobacter vulcani]GER88611.1 hypothetical protein KDW_27730 [Dictyobacter vulcani]